MGMALHTQNTRALQPWNSENVCSRYHADEMLQRCRPGKQLLSHDSAQQKAKDAC
jgi:hypothetical protein